jgi:hypothetical protein
VGNVAIEPICVFVPVDDLIERRSQSHERCGERSWPILRSGATVSMASKSVTVDGINLTKRVVP